MRKILSVAIILSLLLGAVPMSFAASYSPYIRVMVPTEIPEINAGESGEFELSVKNVGVYGAYPLTIKFGEGHPFRADSSELVQDLRYLGAHATQTVKFKVTPNPLSQDRIYEFDVIFTYKDSDENIQTNTEKAYVKINNKNTEPMIAIESVDTNKPKLEKNQQNKLNIKIRNKGTLSANKLKATLSGFSPEGIMLDNDADFKIVGNLDADAPYYLMYNIKTSNAMTYGSHTLLLTLEYNDDFGTSYKKDINIFLSAEDPSKNTSQSQIVISDISYPSSVAQERDFEIKYKVTNKSDEDLSGVVVQYEFPETFVAKKDSKVVLDLKAGESREIAVLMRARKGTTENTYHTNLLAYLGGSETPAVKEYVGIYVLEEEDAKVSKANRPKLIVEDYEYGGSAKAGEEFELVMNIKNTSANQYTKNIKIVLSSDGTFTPVNSSSSIFVDGIAPGETKRVGIKLRTKADAAVQIYKIGVKMDYEDGEGKAFDAQNNPFSESEDLSVQVIQDAILSLNGPFMAPTMYVGERYYINAQYYNEGKARVTNLKVKIEGVPVMENSSYIGNFEPGQSDEYSISFTPEEEGEFQGKLIFEYQNPVGEIEVKELDFSYFVLPASEKPAENLEGGDMPFPMQPEEEASGTNWTLILGIALGVLVLAGIVAAFVAKNRKYARRMIELESMFEEEK